MRSSEQLEAQVRDTIGHIGLAETLRLLARIAEGFADARSNADLPVGGHAAVAAGLSNLAEECEHYNTFELRQSIDEDLKNDS